MQSHIHYPEEFKRERAEEERWLAESMDYFKNWIYPLRKVFSNYSRDFMPLRTKTIDFDELQKLRSGLTISDWMIFVNDFELMPWQVTKTQALAIFHYSNLKLGAMNTDLGARRGAQIISFEEYISCLRGVAMGEGFRSLPTSDERINALGSYMRRQAYIKGKNNKVMERRMGNAKIWEKRGFLPLPSSTERVDCPMVEYKFTVPKVLALDESVAVAMEMVDHIVAHAIQRHILTLVRLPLERTVIEPPEAWDGGSTGYGSRSATPICLQVMNTNTSSVLAVGLVAYLPQLDVPESVKKAGGKPYRLAMHHVLQVSLITAYKIL